MNKSDTARRWVAAEQAMRAIDVGPEGLVEGSPEHLHAARTLDELEDAQRAHLGR